ncbi:MAG: S8 family serine peptidase [Sporichthyaceae bacterium]
MNARRPVMRSSLAASAVLSMAVALVAALPGSAAGAGQSDPIRTGGVIPGEYVVIFEPTASASSVRATVNEVESGGAQVTAEYTHVIDGFAAKLSVEQAEDLAGDPQVRLVSPNMRHVKQVTQTPVPSFGLDRIDQRDLPLNNSYTYTSTGSGVRAYVIDSGLRADHQQFAGRVGAGFNAASDQAPNNPADCADSSGVGHGTHVAGTIGGATVGVAKAVTIVPVRVFPCGDDTDTETIVKGLDFVVAQHNALDVPSVANLSLGGNADSALDAAVQGMINVGISTVVAAGNSNSGIFGNDSACSVSPARLPAAITVGSSDANDRRSSFSNRGSCLDIFAPGRQIVSAGIASSTELRPLNGTSFAAPHVAGVAAMYLQNNPGATPGQVRDALVAGASDAMIDSTLDGSPDRLLQSAVGDIGAVVPPPMPPPVTPPPGTPPPTPPTPPTPPVSISDACAGRGVPAGFTVRTGTPGEDTLVGTSGRDLIRGLGGDDFIDGAGSGDILCGNQGNDVIYGGSGADVIRGGKGDDFIRSGPGADDVRGESGRDDER